MFFKKSLFGAVVVSAAFVLSTSICTPVSAAVIHGATFGQTSELTLNQMVELQNAVRMSEDKADTVSRPVKSEYTYNELPVYRVDYVKKVRSAFRVNTKTGIFGMSYDEVVPITYRMYFAKQGEDFLDVTPEYLTREVVANKKLMDYLKQKDAEQVELKNKNLIERLYRELSFDLYGVNAIFAINAGALLREDQVELLISQIDTKLTENAADLKGLNKQLKKDMDGLFYPFNNYVAN